MCSSVGVSLAGWLKFYFYRHLSVICNCWKWIIHQEGFPFPSIPANPCSWKTGDFSLLPLTFENIRGKKMGYYMKWMLRLSENPALLKDNWNDCNYAEWFEECRVALRKSLCTSFCICIMSVHFGAFPVLHLWNTLCITLEISLSLCEDSGLSKASWVSKMMFCWDQYLSMINCQYP